MEQTDRLTFEEMGRWKSTSLVTDVTVFFLGLLCSSAFLRTTFSVNNPNLLLGLFIMLFVSIWALALATGRNWVIASACILLALAPVNASVGLSFAGLWLLLSLCLYIFVIGSRNSRHESVQLIIDWQLLGIFAFSAFISYLFYDSSTYGSFFATSSSLLGEVIGLFDRLTPIVFGPAFFALTLRNSKQRLSSMLMIMISVLLFYALVVGLGSPTFMKDDSDLEVGYAMQYTLWGQDISMIRTGVGIILSIIAATSFALIIEKRAGFAALMTFIAGSLGIIFGGGRGAFVALFLTICVYVLMTMRRLGIKRYFSTLLVTLVLAVIVLNLVPQIQDAYDIWSTRWELAGNASIDNGRTERWVAALEQMRSEPLGLGRWTLVPTQYPEWFAHNDYFAFGMSYGILGGLAYSLAMVYAFLSIYRTFKRTISEVERGIAGAALAALICLAINSMADHLISDKARYFLSWFIVGIGWSIAKSERHIANE